MGAKFLTWGSELKMRKEGKRECGFVVLDWRHQCELSFQHLCIFI